MTACCLYSKQTVTYHFEMFKQETKSLMRTSVISPSFQQSCLGMCSPREKALNILIRLDGVFPPGYCSHGIGPQNWLIEKLSPTHGSSSSLSLSYHIVRDPRTSNSDRVKGQTVGTQEIKLQRINVILPEKTRLH